LALPALMFEAGDIIVDGGNSHCRDNSQRAAAWQQDEVRYVDVDASVEQG